MSNALTHDAVAFIAAPAADATVAAPPAVAEHDPAAPPVGYRWVSKRWRVLPDGTRDYAAYYGKTAFNMLLPVSSRLHTRKY